MLKGGVWKVLLLVLFVAKVLDIVRLLKPNTTNVLETDLPLSSGGTGKGENQLHSLRLALLKVPTKVGSSLSTFHMDLKSDLTSKTL